MNYKTSNDPILQLILNRLIPEFNPTKVYLFGSRGRGEARPNSDYDLFLVVKESDLRPIQRMQKAYRLLWDIKVSIDVFIYTSSEFDQWKDELNSIPHTASHEGLELELG